MEHSFITRRVQRAAFFMLICLVGHTSATLTVIEKEALAFLAQAQADARGAFQIWKQTCTKRYSSAEAEKVAFSTWLERRDDAIRANAQPGRLYFASLNCISDWPIPKPLPTQALKQAEEQAAGATALPRRNLHQTPTGWKLTRDPSADKRKIVRAQGYVDGTQCPESMDWRQVGAVTGVKSQGSTCGSCWAFAATGSIEAAQFLATGQMFDLSESQLVDCVTGTVTNGCNGGNVEETFNHIIRTGGIASTASYGSYTGVKQVCRFDPAAAAVQLTGFASVQALNETALLQAVCNQPVAISLEANAGFMAYSGGVYDAVNCGGNINHAVLVVGYGVDATTNTPVWIVKNSWGASWGEGGYVRIKRGSNVCGLVTMSPSFPTVAGAPPPEPAPVPIPVDPPAGPVNPSCPPTYTVVSGDSLFGIASKYLVNFLTLLAANPAISTPDVIFPGQVINIPCLPASVCAATYMVKPGDTLFLIGSARGISLVDILTANPQFVNPDIVYPGNLVFIPPCTAPVPEVRVVKSARAACTASTYTAIASDTPYRVAAKFNMNLGDLYRLNPSLRLFRTSRVTAGQVLKTLACPKVTRLSYTTPRSCAGFYTVLQGDTTSTAATKASTSIKAGTTVSRLMVANPWITSATQPLPARRRLCVP